MKIAVLTRRQDAFSMVICREQVAAELRRAGAAVLPFAPGEPVPAEADLVWEPSLSGNRTPPALFRRVERPFIATVHGAVFHTLPWRELHASWRGAAVSQLRTWRTLRAWRWFGERAAAVATVSHYAAAEAAAAFGIPSHKLHPIYHGVDPVFTAEGRKEMGERPYFLQIAQYRPKKNVDRVIEAYGRLPQNGRPDLILIMPGYTKKISIPGIRLIREKQTPAELAAWYRGAVGFLFPSLHESFGMPLVEAMACGCPVITANAAACPEIVGDAALLINPRSVDAIRGAMAKLSADAALQQNLRQRGLARAAQFSWQKSAQAYLDLFERVLAKGGKR